MYKILTLMTLICIYTYTLIAQNLNIEIEGIRNDIGLIRLAFFSNEEQFKSETPIFEKIIESSNSKDGHLSITYNDIKPGQYGIALLHDEDKNGKMTYSLCIPSEGFGFSNYSHKGLTKPSFIDFCFIYGNSEKTIKIRVKYI